jgi:signal transduction histidine kinase
LGRLGAAIDAAVVVVHPQAVKKGVTLENAVAGYGAAVTYFGDEGRVRQILINLLVNSVKFTPLEAASRSAPAWRRPPRRTPSLSPQVPSSTCGGRQR